MNTLSHDSEIVARDWLCESQGDPTTAGLRHAVMLLLGHAEAEIERLRAIVDRLPTTADGVPVMPGMRLWTSYNSGRDVSGFEVNSDGNLTCLHFRDGGFDRCVWAHYSSREAADAAGGSDV